MPNVNENGKQNYFRRNVVAGTPIEIIETESACFAAIGMHKITADHETKEEVEQKLHERDWNTLLNVIAYVVNRIEELKEVTELQNALKTKN